jgi:hypothetical protein
VPKSKKKLKFLNRVDALAEDIFSPRTRQTRSSGGLPEQGSLRPPEVPLEYKKRKSSKSDSKTPAKKSGKDKDKEKEDS